MLTLCILNFNGNDSLRESIQSVLNQTRKPDRFVVIDNASTDDSRQIAIDMGVEVVDADNRHKFITGLNTAIGLNKDKLFFMQNDVVLDINCLKTMIKNCKEINYFAQPVIYDTKGNIDNSGMDYIYPGMGKRRNNEWWIGHNNEECGLVTTICFMTNITELWDVRFSPAYYEDIDMYLQTRNYCDHLLVPKAKAIHKGNHTFSQSYKKEEISRICFINRNKLIRKHYKGIDKLLRLTVSTCLYIVAKSLRVITNRWISKNHLK